MCEKVDNNLIPYKSRSIPFYNRPQPKPDCNYSNSYEGYKNSAYRPYIDIFNDTLVLQKPYQPKN